MFRSFIYLDEHKLYTYKRQIDGKNDVQPKAVSQKKNYRFFSCCERLRFERRNRNQYRWRV